MRRVIIFGSWRFTITALNAYLFFWGAVFVHGVLSGMLLLVQIDMYWTIINGKEIIKKEG